MEPRLIVLIAESDRFLTFQREGIEMLYMLEGVVDYLHSDQIYPL